MFTDIRQTTMMLCSNEQTASYLWNVFDECDGKFDVGEIVQILQPRNGMSNCDKQ